MRCPLPVCLASLGLLAACARHSSSTGDPSVVNDPRTWPLYETRFELPAGPVPLDDLAVADLDGDGDADLALFARDGSVRIRTQDEDGVFVDGQRIELGTAGTRQWLAATDLDGDGDKDLAAARSGATEGSVAVLWNDGTAQFTAGPVLDAGSALQGLQVADMNGDGSTDVFVTRPVAPQLRGWFGGGAKDFVVQASAGFPGATVPAAFAIGDVTRDGILDVVASDPAGNRVLVLRGAAGGQSFLPTPTFFAVASAPGEIALGDVSGDGHLDIVVGASSANRCVVITNPQGNGSQRIEKTLPGTPSLCAVADVNGDQLRDLLVCVGDDPLLVVVPGTAPGGLGQPVLLDAAAAPRRAIVTDVNGDGFVDVVTLPRDGSRIDLWVADDADARLQGSRAYHAQLPAAQFVAGSDFDRNGTSEVAVAGEEANVVSILGGSVAAGLMQVAQVDVGRRVLNLECADLDADGDDDLMVCVTGGVKLVRNDSGASGLAFTVLPGGSAVHAPGQSPFGIETADLDGNGFLDIVVADNRAGMITVLPGTAVPFEFAQHVTVNLAGRPGDVELGDFDGDTDLDVAVARWQYNDIAILRNDGALVLVPHMYVPVQQAPRCLVSCDFNRDGKVDLVAANTGSASVSVLFSTGSGFNSVTFPAGETPTALLARDIDGDNLADLLVTSRDGGDFRVLCGNGVGLFPRLHWFPGTPGAVDALLQDMNGDSFPELVISGDTGPRVSLVRHFGQR